MSAEQRGVTTSLDIVPVLLFMQPSVLLTLTAAAFMGAPGQLLSATSSKAVSGELSLDSHPPYPIVVGVGGLILPAGLYVCPY